MRDTIGETAAGTMVYILITVIVMTIVVAVGSIISAISCYNTGNDMGLNTKYTIASGCMVEIQPRHFIPLSNYRYVDK